jgi:hypothetical protein
LKVDAVVGTYSCSTIHELSDIELGQTFLRVIAKAKGLYKADIVILLSILGSPRIAHYNNATKTLKTCLNNKTITLPLLQYVLVSLISIEQIYQECS